jgi:hypothetical protein
MIPLLHPNLFLEQQSRHLTPGEAEQFLQLNGRSFPDSNFFVIGRLESGYPYLKFPISLHRPNFYSIMLVSRGEVVRTDGLNTYTVGEGSIHFHFSGAPPTKFVQSGFAPFAGPHHKGYAG